MPNCYARLALFAFTLIRIKWSHCAHALKASSSYDTNTISNAFDHETWNPNLPGIPISILYDKNTSQEIRHIVERALNNINKEIKDDIRKISYTISILDVSNCHELVRTVCAQLSRGVVAIFGPTSLASLDILKSVTNFYNIPYISWSYLDRLKPELIQQKDIKKRNVYSQKEFHSNVDELEEDVAESADFYDTLSYDHIIEQESEYPQNATDHHSASASYQIYMRPDLAPVLISLIDYWAWHTIYYIYNYAQAITTMEKLFEQQNNDPNFLNKMLVRRASDTLNFRDMLRAIEASNEQHANAQHSANKKIIMIIDLDSKESYMHFLNQIKDLGMTKAKYNYVLATLGIYELDVNDFRHGGAKIFGFSIVDYYNIKSLALLSDILQTGEPLNKIAAIPFDAALLVDSFVYFNKSINHLIGKNVNSLFGMQNVSLKKNEIYINNRKGAECSYDMSSEKKWPLGKFVLDHLKSSKQVHEGLTGQISFDMNGRRKKYSIGVYKVGLNFPLRKIGSYTADKGLKINEEKIKTEKEYANTSEKKINRKLTVVSIKDDPFLMIRPNEPGKNYTGNDRFMGYCVDLTKKIAEIVNFTYEIRLVKDSKFGSRDASGNWDGIVGELVRHEADIAVAPLTISSQRERAIEFSMPFMNIGISIMIKKPKKEKPGVFSFMAPLDSKIWLCVILAYIGVSVVLFLVSRFSPYEWHYDAKKDERGLVNDFSISNTLWFNLAAVMQQGVDIAPKAASGRVAASAWWFFTLILISSYTANLAAFLTVERMVSPIESAEQLSRQTEIQYGALEGGSTKEFFRNSKVDTYQRMWNFMSSWGPSVFVRTNAEGVQKVRESKGKYAYLLESSLNEYLNERLPCDTMKVGSDLDSKGYGIATPIRSELRDPINLAVLQLREEGYLDELKTKWWYDRSECGNSASGSKDSSQSALNLINVAGIFYVLIIGLLLAILVATCELLYKAKKQAKKNNIEFREAVKSKMRLSISGYEDGIKELRKRTFVTDVDSTSPTHFPAFPNLDLK